MMVTKVLISFGFLLLVSVSSAQVIQIPEKTSPFLHQRLHQIVIDGEPVNEASPGAHSIVQVIVRGAQNSSSCTGVVVSPRYIMTSGHCFNGEDPQVQIRFTHLQEEIILDALDYRFTNHAPSPRSGDLFVNGFLVYDRQKAFNFYETMGRQRTWSNFPEYSEVMIDLALVKINQLPSGAKPLRFYQGELSFRQDVVVIGYGINSRIEEEVDRKAYFAHQKLIGYVQNNPGNILGWQTYSTHFQTMCFGDSGGPLLIMNSETEEWEILGIQTAVINNCANSAFSTYPLSDHLEELTKRWVEEMNSSEEL